MPVAGSQTVQVEAQQFYAAAVRLGDVVAVLEPQTYALMLIGLTALIVVRRYRH